MAHWLPNFDTCRSKLNPLEQILADNLEEQLPAYVSIISNYRWQKTRENKAPIDLECDFIIFWPERGLLVLEVKGEMKYRYGKWVGRSRSPTDQARNSRFDICDILAKASYENTEKEPKTWRDRCIALPTFPNAKKTDWPGNVDGFDCDQIFTKEDVLSIKDAIFEKTKTTTHLCKKLSENQCLVLARRLLPDVTVKPDIKNLLQGEQEQIESVTQEQLKAVTRFCEFPYLFICGPAGSGKTILGLTTLNAWLNKGSDTYYLTSNPHLAQHLQRRFPNLSKNIHSFRSFTEEILKTEIKTDRLSLGYFTELFLNYKSSDRDFRFILDESQDVDSDFVGALNTLGNVKQLWILYDNQQVLDKKIDPERFERDIADKVGERIDRLPWNMNLRNTQKIAEYSLQFVQTETEPCRSKPVGQEPEILSVDNSKEQSKEVKKVLHHLIGNEKVSPNDIVIISCLDREQILDTYIRTNSDYFGRKICYLSPLIDQQAIQISTVLDFKGLESKVIILIDTQNAKALNVFYLGGSRAVLRLYIIRKEFYIANPTDGFIDDLAEAGLDF